jgi:hypothetical protein
MCGISWFAERGKAINHVTNNLFDQSFLYHHSALVPLSEFFFLLQFYLATNKGLEEGSALAYALLLVVY